MFRASLIAGLVIATALPSLAAAQSRNCGPRQVVLSHLADRFGESRRAVGMVSESRVMEVFASAESGSWTITITMPDGTTCLMASGESFETLTEALRPAGQPS